MRRPWHDELRPARDLPFVVLCVAVTLSMIRAVDQPSLDLALFGTDVSVVPADLALALLGALAVVALLGRGSLPRPARAMTGAAAGFCAWLLLSSAANGSDAVVGAGKLLEVGVLGLGVVLFIRRRPQLWLLVALLVAITLAAVAYGLYGFVFDDPGSRQPSFLGEHDFAALATMSLTIWLASLYARGHGLGRLPLAAGVAGLLGVTLGAALAGLLGLYLAVGAIVAIAAVRGAVTARALALTALAATAVTVGSIAIRSADLGFLRDWLDTADEVERPGQYSASWSQRLIFAYLGGRVFLDNPVLGTGWHGELPPEEFAGYLPDARRRFPNEPPHYFPRPDGTLIPQQTYDQVLYELGLVGALLFLLLGVLTVRTAVRVGLGWPRDGPDEALAYLPIAWTASLAGALAGAALFGGIPLAGIFWLTLGIVALAPSLMPPERAAAPPSNQRELATAAR